MKTDASPACELPGASARAQAKRRLYTVLQFGGWGLLTTFQIVVTFAIGGKKLPTGPGTFVLLNVVAFGLGAVLTHYFRLLIHRWGWKNIGWKALVLRMIASSIALGVFWTLVVDGLLYGLFRQPWTASKSPAVVIPLYCINDSLVMFGWLGIYFGYHVYNRIHQAQIEQQRLMAATKEAELRALKSQVNPHFIFNSLNSLRSLIDEDPRRARLAVTQLANLLRYSLQSGQMETVSFEQELQVVQDYLALEQVRFEDRLHLRLDIAEDTLSLQIPPMLLQTLAENAIKYGIAQQPAGGEIAISAQRDKGLFRIQVSNPGTLAPSGGQPGSSTGLGIKNALDRLRLLFGERASLELIQGAPGQVLAQVSIPLTGGDLPTR
jgi:two-component sensor histidine kinase